MNRPLALNALDRAVRALGKSTAAMPDLYRGLVQGKLHALVPSHPEIDDATFKLENGSPVPFVILTDADGEFVPIFSSHGRLEEGLRRGRAPRNQYAAASLPARELMEILGAMNLRAVLNKTCSTGEVSLPADMMRDLANGKALEPIPLTPPTLRPPGQSIRLQYVPAHARPTALVQAAFEILRAHAEFKAAWVFTLARPPEPPAAPWHMFFLMDPRDEAVFHDLNIAVTAAARLARAEVSFNQFDASSQGEIKVLFDTGEPFYLAPGFKPPP